MAATGMYIPEIAKQNNISKAHMYRVIGGDHPSPDVRAIISKIVQRPEEELWPESTKAQPLQPDGTGDGGSTPNPSRG